MYHSQRLLFLQELQELEPRKQLLKKYKQNLILILNRFVLIAQPIFIQQNISNLMDQRASTFTLGQQDLKDYKDAEKNLKEEFTRAKQTLEKMAVILKEGQLDDEDRKQLSKAMEPFINFVDNKTKAAILCTGSISSGKSSLLNALLGNCILPSGNLETTETITKLIPSQELNSNICQLIKDNGTTKKQYDIMEIYKHHDQYNINQKQNTQKPLVLEIQTNFIELNDFKDNPLLQRHQLEFVDLPGCDSKQEGKDKRILDYSSQLGDFPKLVLFTISPENISKESTNQFLKTAKRVLSDEINSIKRVQNQFYTILQGIYEQEIKNDNYNQNSESTEKLVQQQLCIVISKYDTLQDDAEAKKIEDELTTNYQIQPNFVSSKKQIEYNTLKHRINTLNISILLNDQEVRRQALIFFPKDRVANLSQIGPAQWTEGDIKHVLDNTPKLFQHYFTEDENVELRTRVQQFVLQLMIKITNQCQQYLWNNSRKIEHLSEAFQIGLSQKIRDEQLNPKEFDWFYSASAQCYTDLDEQILTMQKKQLTQLNTSIEQVEIFFKDIENLVGQIQKGQFEQIQKPLEDITKDFHEEIYKLTQDTIEAIIAIMKKQMPFLNGEIHTKIGLIFKVQILARQQVWESNLQDQLKPYGQISSGRDVTYTNVISSFLRGIASFTSSVFNWNKIRKNKEQIRNLLKSEQQNLKGLLQRNLDYNFNKNIECLKKSLKKVLQALDNAYAQKKGQ